MSESPPGRPTVRDFLVDLLGSLVPGILFVFLSLCTIAWPVWILAREIQEATPIGPQVFEQATRLSEIFRFELVAFFIVASYVAGHFLFRQDPKIPDEHSYRRVSASREFIEKDAKSWVVRPDRGADTGRARDVQFPYRYLREYLQDRKLEHLAAIVPWSGNDEDTWHQRTKSFINILKIRLMFHFPDHCGQITRNEAHVRLMSSIWYASNSLSYTSIGGVVIAALAGTVAAWNNGAFQPNFLVPLVFSALLGWLALWARNTVERFLHYQRVREVIFVLETAYIAAKAKPKMLNDF